LFDETTIETLSIELYFIVNGTKFEDNEAAAAQFQAQALKIPII
jgi:hypothetical protein